MTVIISISFCKRFLNDGKNICGKFSFRSKTQKKKKKKNLNKKKLKNFKKKFLKKKFKKEKK